MRLEKATFGPVLRAARERRGVTLKQLAEETKLSVELWASLEDNDLTRWPKRVFARSYVRDYALRVGLDADEVVNEFCRLFPEWGDRRAEQVIRGKAEIIAHELEWEDLPTPRQRRSSDRPPKPAPGFLSRHRVRLIGVVLDLQVVLSLGLAGVRLGLGFWPTTAVVGVLYSVLATLFFGRSFGLVVGEWIHRVLKSLSATSRYQSSGAQRA